MYGGGKRSARVKRGIDLAFVEFRDVRKVYTMGEVEVAAVDGMTFDIERGELVVTADALKYIEEVLA